MNILILSHSFLHNGKEATEITINSFARELEEKGHTVHIIPEKSILKTIQKARKLKKEKNISFDVIHGFSAAPLLATKVILTKLLVSRKARTVQTIKSYSKHFFGSLYFSPLLNLIDHVTVSTEEFKKKLVQCGCLNKKIHLISHYDTDGISSAAILSKTLRRLQKQFSLKIIKQS